MPSPVMNTTFIIPLTMTLSDYIRVLPTLDKQSCEDLITTFYKHESKHKKRSNKVQHFTELNYNEVAPPVTLNQLCRKIRTLTNIYTDHNPTGGRFFPAKYGLEEFRIKCYNDDDCFSPHVDVGDRNSSKRFLAFLFYLNDNFDGGNTEFRLPQKQVIKPEQGSVLMFPPTWQYPHEGKPVLAGTKFIMSTYLHYV